jgi:putative tryptophan/tyrosine transport system substrate-binding protein
LSTAPAAYLGKILELLTEAVPGVRRVGVLSDPTYHGLAIPALEAAARGLAVELRPLLVKTADQLDTAFVAMIDAGAEAVLVLNSSITFANRARVAALALEHHLPSILDIERQRKRAAF